MAVDETNVATAALVIAISAFVIACGQLLQQLFATADGLRRCQQSVIGDWSKLVKLKFRWSSFRFEVVVTTPHFEIAEPNWNAHISSKEKWENASRLQKTLHKTKYLCDASEPTVLIGASHSRRQALSSAVSTEETVTWLSFMNDVHTLQGDTLLLGLGFNPDLRYMYMKREKERLAGVSLLCLTPKSRSWDFMPPEVVRPVASTTIGCILSLVYRFGMTWIDLRPEEGVLRATGNGRSISGSRIRGLGLVIEYNQNGLGFAASIRRRIPSIAANQMASGILPSRGTVFDTFGWSQEDLTLREEDLSLRDSKLPVMLQLAETVQMLHIGDNAIDAIRHSLSHKETAQALPGFADLLGLWSDWLPLSRICNQAENPFPVQVSPMGQRPEARIVWRWLLQNRAVAASSPISTVLETFNEWERGSPLNHVSFHFYRSTDGRDIDEEILTFFKSIFDKTTSYFTKFAPQFYAQLVRKHISINALSLRQAEENVRVGHKQPRPHVPCDDTTYRGDPLFTERAFIYAENIPKIVDAMYPPEYYPRSATDAYFPHVEDGWWMLMLRMQAWNMGVQLIWREGLTVPHYYYNDPTHVYIL